MSTLSTDFRKEYGDTIVYANSNVILATDNNIPGMVKVFPTFKVGKKTYISTAIEFESLNIKFGSNPFDNIWFDLLENADCVEPDEYDFKSYKDNYSLSLELYTNSLIRMRYLRYGDKRNISYSIYEDGVTIQIKKQFPGGGASIDNFQYSVNHKYNLELLKDQGRLIEVDFDKKELLPIYGDHKYNIKNEFKSIISIREESSVILATYNLDEIKIKVLPIINNAVITPITLDADITITTESQDEFIKLIESDKNKLEMYIRSIYEKYVIFQSKFNCKIWMINYKLKYVCYDNNFMMIPDKEEDDYGYIRSIDINEFIKSGKCMFVSDEN